jgi:hypothetical protein
MANVTINQLSAVSSLKGSDEIPIARDGISTNKITYDTLSGSFKDLIESVAKITVAQNSFNKLFHDLYDDFVCYTVSNPPPTEGWLCPNGVTKIRVLVIAGSGGGGAYQGAGLDGTLAGGGRSGGGGVWSGGSGGAWVDMEMDVVPGQYYSVTVGKQGAAAGYQADGGDGGDSKFNTTATNGPVGMNQILCKGGIGGRYERGGYGGNAYWNDTTKLGGTPHGHQGAGPSVSGGPGEWGWDSLRKGYGVGGAAPWATNFGGGYTANVLGGASYGGTRYAYAGAALAVQPVTSPYYNLFLASPFYGKVTNNIIVRTNPIAPTLGSGVVFISY